MKKVLPGIVSWVLCAILLIPASMLLTIFLIHRWMVTVLLRKIFRPDLGSPLFSQDFLFSHDLVWEDASAVIVSTLLVEGAFELNSLISRLENIISSDKYNYDRLSSVYPTFWIGYPFWIKVKEPFDPTNHIRTVEVDRIDLDGHDTRLLLKGMIKKPFQEGRPLWDMLLVSDLQEIEKRSLLVFRFHHIIGDGFSVLHFLEKLFDEDEENLDKLGLHIRNEVSGVDTAKMIFWTPFTLVTHCLDFLHRDYFRVRNSKRHISFARKTLPLLALKTLRERLNLSADKSLTLGTLILYLFTTAMRKAVLAGEFTPADREAIINTDTLVLMATPKKSAHPRENFCNQWNHLMYKIPLREESVKKLLNQMIRSATFLTNSRADEVIGQITKINSVLPAAIYCSLAEKVRGTASLFTNLPGPASIVHLFGQKVLSMELLSGLAYPHSGFVLCCFSYNNQVTFSLVGNADIITDNTAQVLLQYFRQEFCKYDLEATAGLSIETVQT